MIQKMIVLTDEKATARLGASVSAHRQLPVVIYLIGDLGVGKTTFASGFLQQLGHHGHVKSPTYTLIESYPIADMTVYHCDLYRLADPEELEFIGIRDYFNDHSLFLIEWPQKAGTFIPPADINVELTCRPTNRLAILSSLSEKGNAILSKL